MKNNQITIQETIAILDEQSIQDKIYTLSAVLKNDKLDLK